MPSDTDQASDPRHHERLAGEITESVLAILRKAASEGRLPSDFRMGPLPSAAASGTAAAPAAMAPATVSAQSPSMGSPIVGVGGEEPLVRKPGAPPPAPRAASHAVTHGEAGPEKPRRAPGTGTIRAAIQSAARDFVQPGPAVEIVRYRIALLVLVLCLSALSVALAVSLS